MNNGLTNEEKDAIIEHALGTKEGRDAIERCPKCQIKMRALRFAGEDYHFCKKCKWYYGVFYATPEHPRNKGRIKELDA